MRVGLNVLYLIPGGVGGVEIVARSLIPALVESDGGNEYVVFVSKDARDVFSSLKAKCTVVVCPFRARHRLLRYMWEQLALPWQALLYRLDVLHSMSYVGPIISPVPTVVTIHDANSQRADVAMSRFRRAMLGFVSVFSAKSADAVVAPSEFARSEIIRWYKLTEQKIKLILQGPGAGLLETPANEGSKLEALVSAGPYIMALGGGWTHKNIPRLIQAYSTIADQIPHRLIISGTVHSHGGLEPIPDGVVLTGYLERGLLQELLRQCDLFVMPSLYEGFGLPVLEAQVLGVPVACSNAASLPELMNGSAELFDPLDPERIAAAMKRCVLDRSVNERMRQQSKENVRRFSWAVAAFEFERLYHKVVSQSGKGWLKHTLACCLRVIH